MRVNIYIKMGNGASMQAQTALNSEAAKPLDKRRYKLRICKK